MALCPKQALPDVLQGIGYTAQPTASLTTETPDSLGLRGYPRNPVLCTISVMGDDGHRQSDGRSLQVSDPAGLRRTCRPEAIGPKLVLMMAMALMFVMIVMIVAMVVMMVVMVMMMMMMMI